MTVIFTVNAVGVPMSQTLAYNTSPMAATRLPSPLNARALTEYLALTGILGHDVDHVFCLHHLQ
jgi:hypothetical protein